MTSNALLTGLIGDGDAVGLLGQGRSVQTSRQRRLMLSMLLAGVFGLVGLVLLQLLLGIAPIRFLAMAMAAVVLLLSLQLLQAGQVRPAATLLVWGVAAAVSAQALISGGLTSAGLFAYPGLLMTAGGLLGLRQARLMLGVMVGVLAALALSGGSGQTLVEPFPVGLRALLMAFFLLLAYVGLRAFKRAQERDVKAIESLNGGLHATIEQLRLREAELERARLEAEGFSQVLERRVQARTQELADTIERLQLMQQELVQAEKMAALGALVAGVAHEINTPLGTALICSSSLEASARDLLALIDRPGGLRRSALQQLAQGCLDNAELAQKNLHRAHQLVDSFKEVAVDQSTQQRRVFDLSAQLQALARTVSPSVGPVRLELEIEDGIEMDSYPGALDQVLIELIHNAATHAFEGRTGGRILLSASLLGPQLVDLRCIDDGLGIDALSLERVFEPFYAGRLGQAGSGLGLSVAYNLAIVVLGGSMNATSSPGQGTCFRLLLPRVAKLTPAASATS